MDNYLMFIFGNPLIAVFLISIFSAVLIADMSTYGEKINLRDNKVAFVFVTFLVASACISFIIVVYEGMKTW